MVIGEFGEWRMEDWGYAVHAVRIRLEKKRGRNEWEKRMSRVAGGRQSVIGDR